MDMPVSIKNIAKSYLSDQQIRLIRSLLGSALYSKDLKKLAIVYGSDKWNSHWYAQHYEKHFAALRNKKLNILEIGIGGNDNPNYGGASLRMWRNYFPKSTIYGIDIYDKKIHEEKRIKTFKGSQADPIFLKEVIDTIGKIDIIIDDGSHVNEHVLTSFNILFPALSQDGIYVIEDTHTSYWQKFGGSITDRNSMQTTMGFFKSLTDGLNYEEIRDQNYVPSYFDENIVAMHFYHNLIVIYKGKNNENQILSSKKDN